MTDAIRPRVVVIGAGVAGLVAARGLNRAGLHVEVLEQGSRVGGRIFTDDIHGAPVEAGAIFLTNAYRNTRRVIRDLGLHRKETPFRSSSAIYRDGRLHGLGLDLGGPFGSLLRRDSRVALARMLVTLARHWRELDIHDLPRAHRLDTRSIAEYANESLNEEILEYWMEPLLSACFYSSPERISQAVLFVLLRASIRTWFFTLRGGLGQIPLALARDLTVHLRSRALDVTRDPNGAYAIRVRSGERERTLVADGVVCATPATAVPGLLPDLDEQRQRFFASVRYTGSVIVAAPTERRLPARYYALFFPRRATDVRHLGTAFVRSAMSPSDVPPGRDVLVLHTSGGRGQELLGVDEMTARRRLLDDVRRATPEYDPGDGIGSSRVYQWEAAVPEFQVGHFRRLREFAAGRVETARVVFAGDYLGGPGIEGAVTSGLDAARRLLRRLRAS